VHVNDELKRLSKRTKGPTTTWFSEGLEGSKTPV